MKRLNFVWWALLLICLACSSSTEEGNHAELYEAGGFSIEAGFVPDENQIILGQPLFITFTVSNQSESPFRFFIGGDNRGSIRHNNFRITAVDTLGNPVKDPYSYDNFGGMGRNVVLEYGESYSERLFLGHWCAFEEPGTYIVTCKRVLKDRGEEPRNEEVPVTSSFDLTIAPFKAERMRDIIAGWGKILRDGNEQDLYEASIALASIADEQVIPHLALSLSRGDSQNSLPAIRSLVQFPSEAAANALLVALKAPDYVVRDAGGDALRKINKLDYALRILLPDLKHESPSVRAETARALGATRAKGAFDALLKATHDSEPAVRCAAALGLGTLGYKEAIPRMVELTRSENTRVIRAASQALSQYDTRESTAALIALTKNEDPEIRGRASIDLCRSRRPGVKEALKQILYDKDPHVRANAPKRFINWLRHDEADDVLPRLVEMLNDSVPEVRISAADALGKTRNPDVVPPLIAELKKKPEDEKMKSKLINALYCHYNGGSAEARELIDEQIELIIEALKAGGPKDGFYPSSDAVSILNCSDKAEAKQALEWAAESHPSEKIRAYAKRCLAK